MANLFDIPREIPGSEELVEALAGSASIRIERIVSHGHTTADGEWYDQAQDEWVVLLQGQASLRYGDGSAAELRAGDWLLIPAGTRHRVEQTSSDPPCIWLAVHGDLTGAAPQRSQAG